MKAISKKSILFHLHPSAAWLGRAFTLVDYKPGDELYAITGPSLARRGNKRFLEFMKALGRLCKEEEAGWRIRAAGQIRLSLFLSLRTLEESIEIYRKNRVNLEDSICDLYLRLGITSNLFRVRTARQQRLIIQLSAPLAVAYIAYYRQ